MKIDFILVVTCFGIVKILFKNDFLNKQLFHVKLLIQFRVEKLKKNISVVNVLNLYSMINRYTEFRSELFSEHYNVT